MKKRGFALVWDNMIPWVIALIVLALVLTLYFVLGEKGEGALSYFKDMLRFGR